jgi:hypothetical protein
MIATTIMISTSVNALRFEGLGVGMVNEYCYFIYCVWNPNKAVTMPRVILFSAPQTLLAHRRAFPVNSQPA